MDKYLVGAVVIMHDNHNNYGTSLQGFATVKLLESLGYDYEIIKYNKVHRLKEFFTTIPLALISGGWTNLKRSKRRKEEAKKNPSYKMNIAIRTQKVNQFKDKYFESVAHYYTGYPDLQKGSGNYNVIFVGSDQVWGPVSLYSKFYNLLFVKKGIPKFSYASSFGVSKILPWQVKGTKKYLDELDMVGVREIRGKEIVDSISSNKAKVVLDPTFLIDRKDWLEYINSSDIKIEEPYIFCYILGKREDIKNNILELKEKTGLKIVFMRHVDDFIEIFDDFGDYAPYDVDALDFVKLINEAEYVCTDSFHGTALSIILQKKFLTFYRVDPSNPKSTHSRIDSVLSMFGLSERLGTGDIFHKMITNIDYGKVGSILEERRKDSLDFLKKGLELGRKNFEHKI
ncbi:MAG: polysaccharide pyruvyl transferase family protein [Bacteroidales bacterium]|nr:polysaccharide pyruvyl transferase family protein [Bacteroidales bacterium]MCC8174690.1 polysaccharide pyruvyl transferase family protein [Odoribacter sp.]